MAAIHAEPIIIVSPGCHHRILGAAGSPRRLRSDGERITRPFGEFDHDVLGRQKLEEAGLAALATESALLDPAELAAARLAAPRVERRRIVVRRDPM
jgi:hypothetical protein